MSFKVYLADDTVEDLQELHEYIAKHDSLENSEYVLSRLEDCFESLSENPECGSYPIELLDFGIRDYREIYFKPYRGIYFISGKAAHVMVVADGRRDMSSLLQWRLLRG